MYLSFCFLFLFFFVWWSAEQKQSETKSIGLFFCYLLAAVQQFVLCEPSDEVYILVCDIGTRCCILLWKKPKLFALKDTLPLSMWDYCMAVKTWYTSPPRSRKAWGPLSKICALKPDILLYPPEARYIKEPPTNLHRMHVSEESYGAHEKFFVFCCTQIQTCIKHLKHTSVMFCGVWSGRVRDRGNFCARF